jgi:prepilin-type N-terminal cleavage/methylation domain-containing protein
VKKRLWLRSPVQGFTLIEMVIVLAVLAVLGGVALTSSVGAVRDANVEATVQGVEQIAQWRSQIANYNNQGTINCWNSADLSTGCTGNGATGTVTIPNVINEGKPVFWPIVKAKWSAVCDQTRYPDDYRRVTVLVGSCDPNWDSAMAIGGNMQYFVSSLQTLKL